MERLSNQKPPEAADHTVFTQHGPLRMPLDLSQWVPPETIAGWVEDEIGKLDPAKPEVAEFRRLPAEGRPEVMLAVLVLAYATQCFVREEIVAACHSDPVFNRLCHGQAPFPEDLEHFRRVCRPLLEHVLAHVLLRAVREKFVKLHRLPPGLEYSVILRAASRLDTARHMDASEE